jgi:hypothetical protein
MVVVTVELWPGGDKSKRSGLGVAEIANDGQGTETTGNYQVRLMKWGEGRRTWRTGRFQGFPRLRLGPWDLLLRALAAIVGSRNPGTALAVTGAPIGFDPDAPLPLPKAFDEAVAGLQRLAVSLEAAGLPGPAADIRTLAIDVDGPKRQWAGK